MSRVSVRECLFWSASWLIRRASGRPTGPIEITIKDCGSASILFFAGDANVRRTDLWEIASTSLPDGDQVRAFSMDDEIILAAIKSAGSIPLKLLESKTKIKHTRLGILCGNLRNREAIVSNSEGYSLAKFSIYIPDSPQLDSEQS